MKQNQDLCIIIHTVRITPYYKRNYSSAKVSKQLHRLSCRKWDKCPLGVMWLVKQAKISTSKGWGWRNIGYLPFPTVHILLHSLMPGNAAFIYIDLLSVCTYEWSAMGCWALRFTHTQGVTCSNALAVYTIHGLSACISKQVMVGKVPSKKAGKWSYSDSWLLCCLQYCQEQ